MFINKYPSGKNTGWDISLLFLFIDIQLLLNDTANAALIFLGLVIL